MPWLAGGQGGGGGEGGVEPRLRGLVPLGEHPGSLARAPLPCSPSGARFTGCRVIGLAFAHGSLYHPRRRFRGVWCCGGGGGRQGCLACPMSQRAPPVVGRWRGLAFAGAGGGGPGQWSAGQKGAPLPCAPARRVPPVCAYLAVPPPMCPRLLWPPMIRDHASLPYVLARGRLGGGGAPSLRGPWPGPGSTPGRWSASTHFCGRHQGGPDSRQVAASPHGRRRHSPWVLPSPAPPLGWGLGLRWWRVPRVVAPVAEGGAQGPGQSDIGLRLRDAKHRPPLKKGRPPRLLVGLPRRNHGPEVPFMVLPGHLVPRGTSLFPLSL